MLTKIVDGIEVSMSPEEEASIRAEWEQNESNRPPEYISLRARAYPDIKDQLDILYHEGYDGWHAAIKTVKDTYPKE